jgi:Tfp pilus assembly protein PilN
MLKVNLLPESARRAAGSQFEQAYRMPLAKLGVLGLGLYLAGLIVPYFLYQSQLKTLNARIQDLQPKKLEVDRIQKMLADLRAQAASFQNLNHDGRGLWSKRFNILSDVTPDGVWYTELTLDQDKGLVIQGSALGQGGAEMVVVGRLVQDLKSDPNFTSAVKDIQIESIKSHQEQEIEMVQFTLTCKLLESGGTGKATP